MFRRLCLFSFLQYIFLIPVLFKKRNEKKKKKERGDVFLCTVHAGVIEWSMKLFFRLFAVILLGIFACG